MSSDTFTFPDEDYESEEQEEEPEETAEPEPEPDQPPDQREERSVEVEPPGFEGPMLSANDLSVSRGTVDILSGIDLHVDRGEVVGLVGPAGAGKTTFANAAVGLIEYSGSLEYKGRPVADRDVRGLVEEGLVQCSQERDLFGPMSVADNLRLGGHARNGQGAIDDRLSFVYETFPLLEESKHRAALSLSSIGQQLLAIGRGMMADPDLLVLDEPTIGLAPAAFDEIGRGLERIKAEDVTVLLCEQNGEFAIDHADRIYLIENGDITRDGTPATIRDDPYFEE